MYASKLMFFWGCTDTFQKLKLSHSAGALLIRQSLPATPQPEEVRGEETQCFNKEQPDSTLLEPSEDADILKMPVPVVLCQIYIFEKLAHHFAHVNIFQVVQLSQ